MGTYGVSVRELAGAITDRLDEVEGDFDRATLIAALECCKNYEPVSCETKPQPSSLGKALKKLAGAWRRCIEGDGYIDDDLQNAVNDLFEVRNCSNCRAQDTADHDCRFCRDQNKWAPREGQPS